MRGLVDGDVAEVVVVVDADADTAGLVGDAMADMFVFRYSCTRLKPQPPKPDQYQPLPHEDQIPIRPKTHLSSRQYSCHCVSPIETLIHLVSLNQ